MAIPNLVAWNYGNSLICGSCSRRFPTVVNLTPWKYGNTVTPWKEKNTSGVDRQPQLKFPTLLSLFPFFAQLDQGGSSRYVTTWFTKFKWPSNSSSGSMALPGIGFSTTTEQQRFWNVLGTLNLEQVLDLLECSQDLYKSPNIEINMGKINENRPRKLDKIPTWSIL